MTMPKTKGNARGFTLVELAIAVAITGLSLVSLVALQTRIIANYSKENSLTRAVLYAQYLMAFVEIDAKTKEVESSGGNLLDALSKRDFFNDYDGSEAERERIADWEYLLEVEKEDFGLGDYIVQFLPDKKDIDIARRIRLTISWGSSSAEQYTITYFVHAIKKAPGR
ncbi:MAG: prepilin-type N-terminal cleavage/methylation domain-containing protein [Deltaproteobacteria bacterium]|nr:prepilin-type N-terminal cleavage/methylation domain-containing protein [Deltaproteobacteria bacterium]